MKKTVAILAATCLVAACVPALSGCGNDGARFTLSEEGGKHYIISFSGFSEDYGEYEIPAYYGDEKIPVTEIADEGFASTRFTKITVPETVTKIGVAAFSFCYFLETVEFADGINLESFSRGMFGESDNLQRIKIPDSVKTVEPLVFANCSALSSVEMSAVETIGTRAFEGCTAMESISLPDSLKTIGTLAFYGSGLKSVEIPDSVEDIVTVDDDGAESTVYGLGLAAFNSCVSLESVKVGKGVKVIPSGAFGYCLELKEIRIPLSVEEVQGVHKDEKGNYVYGHAFYYCNALSDIYYEGDEEEWKNIKIDYSLYSSSINNEALKNATKHYGE